MSQHTTLQGSAQYQRARTKLLSEEVELRRQIERVAQARRSLPPGPIIDKEYVFECAGESGDEQVTLRDLFADGKDCLILYSFMFGPQAHSPCPSCTSIVDSLDGAIVHAQQRVNIAIVAKAPLAKLRAFGQTRGWRHVSLLSSGQNDYNRDFRAQGEQGGQIPNVNVFVRDGENIRLFYANELLYAPTDEGQEPRHVDLIWPLWHLLDLSPAGRGDFSPALEYDQTD